MIAVLQISFFPLGLNLSIPNRMNCVLCKCKPLNTQSRMEYDRSRVPILSNLPAELIVIDLPVQIMNTVNGAVRTMQSSQSSHFYELNVL